MFNLKDDPYLTVESGPSMGETFLGIQYRLSIDGLPVVVILKLKWYKRLWLFLNMDIRDVWELLKEKF